MNPIRQLRHRIHKIVLLLPLGVIACSWHTPSGPRTWCTKSNYLMCLDIEEWQLSTPDGCRLYVVEMGRGPRVIVLHGGWGMDYGSVVDGFVPLTDRYRLVFYDQRGSLRSGCTPEAKITVASHVLDLERLREALGEKRLLLAGHSMGTYLAMTYASRYPQHVAGLLLIASVPAQGTKRHLTEDIYASALARWKRASVVATLKKEGLSVEKQPTWSPQQRSRWHRITMAATNLYNVSYWRSVRSAFFFKEHAAAAAEASMDFWDYRAALASLRCPVLILHGDDDYLPLVYHEKWLRDVPNARLQVVKNAGHLLWIDAPEIFREASDKFFRSVIH